MNIAQSLSGLLNVNVGVDAGSSRTRIFCEGRGVVLNESSCIAVSLRTGETVEAGDAAFDLYGRSPAHVEVRHPVRQGVIEDFDTADLMLRHFFNKAFRRKPLFGARVIAAVPTGATDVEKKAFEDLCVQAGAREARLVDACVAAAVGMGLPLFKSKGLIPVILGGGTTQLALLSEGQLLHSGCERVGGEDLNEAISSGARKKYGVVLGYRTLEKLKTELGNVYPMEQEETREVYGKDVIGGLPRAVFISSWEVREMMAAPVERIINSVKNLLEKAPPDLSGEIRRGGIFLCGGGSLIRGMDRLLEEICGVPCKVSSRGALAPIMGVGAILNEFARYKNYTSVSSARRFAG